MIENMILQGLAGGVGMEHPTSVSYSQAGGLVLSGITEEPFCVLFTNTYSNLGTSYRVTGMYLKEPSGNSVIMNTCYRRASDASTSSTTFTSMTYNSSSNEVTLKLQSQWVLSSNNLAHISEVYCLY